MTCNTAAPTAILAPDNASTYAPTSSTTILAPGNASTPTQYGPLLLNLNREGPYMFVFVLFF